MSKLRELIDRAENTPLYSCERYDLQVWAWQNIKSIADLIDAAKEVIRISDRKHDAWDTAKEAIAKLEESK